MKRISKCWGKMMMTLMAAAFLALVPLTAVQADVINFDSLLPIVQYYTPVPIGYGSTADVTVSYRTLDPTLIPVPGNPPQVWDSGYGDLKTAVYAGYSGGILEITLTANNPSQSVVLNSFAVAAYPTGTDSRKADIFEVIDGNGNVLYDYKDFDISGSVAQILSPSVKANSISILLGYNWNNGINNINFSTSAVPVPAAMWLLGSGLIGLIGMRKKSSYK